MNSGSSKIQHKKSYTDLTLPLDPMKSNTIEKFGIYTIITLQYSWYYNMVRTVLQSLGMSSGTLFVALMTQKK